MHIKFDLEYFVVIALIEVSLQKRHTKYINGLYIVNICTTLYDV